MKNLKKLGSKMALAGAALLGAAAVVMADTSGSSNCPSCTSPQFHCCIYFSNGNPFILSCCSSGEKCQVKSVSGAIVAGPYSATATYGKAGCQ